MTRPSWLRTILLFLLIMFGAAPTSWAGAWTLPRNRWYAEYFYRYLGSKREFDNQGRSHRRAKTALFEDIRNEWKLEYGVTDWLNVLASVPYISSHFRDDGIDLLRTGAGDIYVRTKLRALVEPVVTSAQFSWKIPSAYDPNKNPIGDGQVDFESRLQLSRSFTFAPYQVPSRTKAAHSPAAAPLATRVKLPTHEQRNHKPAVTREEAMREAILTAMLYQEGKRLREEGRHEEAARLLRAVVEPEPSHAEARRLYPPLEWAEGLPEEALMETRYAGVAFFNFEGGLTARNEDPANEAPLFLEAGFTPLRRLLLIGSLESVTSIRSTHEQEEDFTKWGLRAIVNLRGEGFASVFREERGATVNAEIGYNDVVAGRNTADGFEIFLKLGVFF